MYENNLLIQIIAKQRHQELLKEAEHQRPLRSARPAQPYLNLVANVTRKFHQALRPQTAH